MQYPQYVGYHPVSWLVAPPDSAISRTGVRLYMTRPIITVSVIVGLRPYMIRKNSDKVEPHPGAAPPMQYP